MRTRWPSASAPVRARPPSAVTIERIWSLVAPWDFKRPSKTLAPLQDDVPLLDQRGARPQLGLGDVLHVLGHDAHLDRAERGVDDARVAEGVGEAARLPRPRQEELGRDRNRRTPAGFERGPALLLDLRRDIVVAERGQGGLDRRWR